MSTEPEPNAAIVTIERAMEVSNRLVAVRSEISTRFMEMGRLLQEAYVNNHATQLGYASFEAYVNDRLDMSYRKARYLADCVSVYINQLGIPPEEIEGLGWTRAKELIPVITGGTPENAREWIERAKTMKTSEINLAVRKAKAPPGQSETLQKYETLGIGMFDDERQVIERAIELSKREGATDRTGRALMLICADYLAEAEGRHEEQIQNPTPIDHTS